MATLLNTENGEKIILRSQHIFGRHPGSANTVLNNPQASRIHASLLYNGSHWLLQDTSTNGTFINGEHFVQGAKHRLNAGDIINFGDSSTANWKLLDVNAPKNLLIPMTDNLTLIELDDIVVLPNEESPQVMLYQSPQGHWLCEDQSGVVTVQSGHKITTRVGSWYFVAADTLEETRLAAPSTTDDFPAIEINFEVSQNEEHVSLSIALDNQLINLGHRTHHYLLLLLARQRLADNDAGLDDNEKGWVDREILSKNLGMDESHINIQIYRLRKQMTKAIPSFPVLLQIIQRRRGELRFACDSVRINGGCHA